MPVVFGDKTSDWFRAWYYIWEWVNAEKSRDEYDASPRVVEVTNGSIRFRWQLNANNYSDYRSVKYFADLEEAGDWAYQNMAANADTPHDGE